jgi:hypothetical protein
MAIHKSITRVRVTEAVERAMSSLDNPGFCVACGAEAEGCEPDARRYDRAARRTEGVWRRRTAHEVVT